MPKALTLDDAVRLAESRGGVCLSEAYVNSTSKLLWRCGQGHEWASAIAQMRCKGNWCPRCAKQSSGRKVSLSIERARKLAADRGGECLSGTYKNNKAMLQWRCGEGHQWRASYNHVSRGRWCPDCANTRRRDLLLTHSIYSARLMAEANEGACLSEIYLRDLSQRSISEIYVDNHALMRWRCSEGHEWENSYLHVQDGQWCPSCKWYKTERMCREACEEATTHLFPTKRPHWLGGLELDGYCEELGVAFEYHGQQHDTYVPFFHRGGPEDLEAQKERDALKIERCADHNIALIVIWHHEVDPVAKLREELDLLGILLN